MGFKRIWMVEDRIGKWRRYKVFLGFGKVELELDSKDLG